ncbi:MAG: hypothetical protein ACFFBP_03275 [Promethearchaeota archaeon]
MIKSETVELSNYTIKNIPGSSGRLDVISRCILSALLGNDCFFKKTQIWIFLDKYGTYVFDSEKLNYHSFPKNELKLTDYFVELIRNKNCLENIPNNPLLHVKISDTRIINIIKEFLNKDFSIAILEEEGQDFFEQINRINHEKQVFIIGNQTGDFLDSEELLELNLPKFNLGTKSYLASSIIRLINLHFKTNN